MGDKQIVNVNINNSDTQGQKQKQKQEEGGFSPGPGIAEEVVESRVAKPVTVKTKTEKAIKK